MGIGSGWRGVWSLVTAQAAAQEFERAPEGRTRSREGRLDRLRGAALAARDLVHGQFRQVLVAQHGLVRERQRGHGGADQVFGLGALEKCLGELGGGDLHSRTSGVTDHLATDDAHDYAPDGSGKYPAGGGWIMVDAPRDPVAILAAIEAGRFYASTGVALTRAEVFDGALEVDVASAESHMIRFIGGGRVLSEVKGTTARFPLAGVRGYVRAVVERKDGARAWVQPIRPSAHSGGH